jgi:hypothetical protein
MRLYSLLQQPSSRLNASLDIQLDVQQAKAKLQNTQQKSTTILL